MFDFGNARQSSDGGMNVDIEGRRTVARSDPLAQITRKTRRGNIPQGCWQEPSLERSMWGCAFFVKVKTRLMKRHVSISLSLSRGGFF